MANVYANEMIGTAMIKHVLLGPMSTRTFLIMIIHMILLNVLELILFVFLAIFADWKQDLKRFFFVGIIN